MSASRRPAKPAGKRHGKHRDSTAVRYHYDVGNDFYRLWLDDRLVYSCGYFPTGAESLDQAREKKLDLICRKLRLMPGEHLLDIGCGWGGLLVHAAKHYGVRARGITLSRAQAELAKELIEKGRLGAACRVELLDFRDLPEDARFDKIASVGMFEHVGHSNLPRYFGAAMRHLREGGLFLNHGIISLDAARSGSNGVWNSMTRARDRMWGQGKFIERYVFPDGELLPLAIVVAAAENAGFETRDVESLREHYAVTLRHWVSRLEACRSRACGIAGDAKYRVWRMYMAASARAFATGRIGVAQMLLSKPDEEGRTHLPMSRADIYLAAARLHSHGSLTQPSA